MRGLSLEFHVHQFPFCDNPQICGHDVEDFTDPGIHLPVIRVDHLDHRYETFADPHWNHEIRVLWPQPACGDELRLYMFSGRMMGSGVGGWTRGCRGVDAVAKAEDAVCLGDAGAGVAGCGVCVRLCGAREVRR